MKHLFLVIVLIGLSGFGFGQNFIFQQVPPLPPALPNIVDFTGVEHSSIAFADVDNDNDLDVLITGASPFSYTCLYLNDGNGNYEKKLGTPFPGVHWGSIAFADIDNDNDQDVLIAGLSGSQWIIELYTNDGSGIFTLVTGTTFNTTSFNDIAFGDIDNDNDQDIIITDAGNTQLYKNDSLGNFTLVLGTLFENVNNGSVSFADIDNDNDLDILITGTKNTSQYIAKLYSNNGSGVYNLLNGTTFTGVSDGSIEFADIDNDNDLDLLIAGWNGSQRVSKLYTNDSIGNFTLVSGTPFTPVSSCSVAFADIDNDNDQDVLITGFEGSIAISRLYTNNGSGAFTLSTNVAFEGVLRSSIAFADVDNDNDLDVLITGSANFTHNVANLYINDSIGGFNLVTTTPFCRVITSAIDFSDVDNDNDMDVLIMGRNANNQNIAELYTNDGIGNYTFDSTALFSGVVSGSSAFCDIDNDNDQDLLITGMGDSTSVANLYLNDSNGNFSLVSATIFPAVTYSSISFADVDNDNDMDVMITGLSNYGIITKLYFNNGSGSFTMDTVSVFDNVYKGSISFADVDNDNDQDVLITGLKLGGQAISKLYLNNGSGNFTLLSGTPFIEVSESAIAFADIDNDNDQDVLITGKNGSLFYSILYTNNGSGVFTQTNFPLNGLAWGTISFVDIDNDNDQDVMISGSSPPKLFINDGSGTFLLHPIIFIPGTCIESCAALSDIDNDNDMDILIIASFTPKKEVTNLYRNISCFTIGVDTQIACDSYTWTNGITYTASNNTATDTLINSAGCDSIITLNLTINSANVTITTSDPSITANTSGASYQWLDCGSNYAIIPSETGQSFTATANGNYAVEVTENGCTDTSACITISSVSLKENSFLKNVSIFPNPSNGLVNIELGNIKDVTIKVLNSNGQLVYEKEDINTKSYQFELKEAVGVYFIEVYSGVYKREFKLVLEH